MYFWQEENNSILVLGLHSKDRKSTRDKSNTVNPKVNKGCPPLTANHTSADCDENSLGPPIYSTEGLPYWWFNAMDRRKWTPFSYSLAEVDYHTLPPWQNSSIILGINKCLMGPNLHICEMAAINTFSMLNVKIQQLLSPLLYFCKYNKFLCCWIH